MVESKRDQWPSSCKDGIMRTAFILPLTHTLRDRNNQKNAKKYFSDIRQQTV